MSTESESNSTSTEVKTLTPADVSRLETAIKETEAKLAAANGEMEKLMSSKDISAVLKQADVVKQAERDLAKAKLAYERGTYDLKKEERMAAAVELKTAVEKFTNSVKLEKYTGLGLRGFSVVFNGEGGFNVNIGEPAQKGAPKGVRKSTAAGESKARALWALGGEQYTSRQLLETFGGQRGADAIDRAENWREPRWGPNHDAPMAAGPGFDAAVKALARSMGWNGDDDRILTHEPA